MTITVDETRTDEAIFVVEEPEQNKACEILVNEVQCGAKADYVMVIKCCGRETYICEEHLFKIYEMSKRGIFTCNLCNTRFDHVMPYLVTKL